MLNSHGFQERNTLDSEFLYGRLSLEHYMELNFPHAVLSFFSTCEKAKGDKYASDQAIHLAGSMLFCGFRSVIGIM
jgi:hypothetical protein